MGNCAFKKKTGLLAIVITALVGMTANAQSGEMDDVKARLAKLEAGGGKSIMSSVEFGGVVEFEGQITDEYDGDTHSDISVATVELFVDAAINPHVETHVSFLYEEDGAEFDVDEATITLAKGEMLSLTLGQLYLPFGSFETALINDTLALEIGETLQTAMVANYENNAVSGAFYLFDGDVNRPENVESWGFRLAYATEQFNAGLDVISSIADTDGMVGTFGADDVDESAEGISLHTSINQGDLTVIIEYLAALDAVELSSGLEVEPEAVQLEVDYAAQVNKYDVTFALALQTTDEANGLLPEERFSIGASAEIFKVTTLGVELSFDEDYNGDDKKALIFQLATEF